MLIQQQIPVYYVVTTATFAIAPPQLLATVALQATSSTLQLALPSVHLLSGGTLLKGYAYQNVRRVTILVTMVAYAVSVMM